MGLPAPLPVRRSGVVVPLLCWLALIADGYDLFSYGATVPGLLQAGWGATPGSVGVVASLALVGVLVGSLVAGTLTDLLGRRRLFLLSVSIFSLAMLACGLVPSLESFAAARFVAGVGIGGLLPTAIALASEFAGAGRRSLVIGAVLTGPPVGGLVASLVAIQLVPDGRFQWVYSLGVLPLLLVPVALKLLPESPAFLRARGRTAEGDAVAARFGLPVAAGAPSAPGPHRSPVAALFADGHGPATLGLWLVNACSLLTVFGVSTWLPQVMREAGYGVGSSIGFLLLYSVGAIVGTLVAAALASRVGAKTMVLVGFCAATVSLLLLATRPATGLVVLLVVVIGFGGLGTQNLLNDHVAGYYPAAARATGLGWALGIGRIGAIAGPTYGAWAVGLGTAVVSSSLAFAAPALLGAVVMSRLPRRGRHDRPDVGLPHPLVDPRAAGSPDSGASALGGARPGGGAESDRWKVTPSSP